MKETSNILKILRAIESFQVIQCQMYHEKVAVDNEAIPIHSIQGEVLTFRRVSLCESQHRRKSLGCAHSNVNVNFENVLSDLEETLPQFSSQISTFKNEFKSVIMKIYTLDHKVGNLEHDLAVSKLGNDNKATNKLLMSLEEAKTEHSLLMDQLSKVKSNIEEFVRGRLD